jgi:zinc protease
LTVLDHVLSAGVTSRLYQALVETRLAVDVGAQAYQFTDPGLFTIDLTLSPGVGHAEAEQAVIGVIEKLKREPIGEKELQKAKNIITTQMIFLRDSPFGVVSVLGESEGVSDWKLYVDLPRMVTEVTAADILRVANTYFEDDNRTVGYFIPKEEQA